MVARSTVRTSSFSAWARRPGTWVLVVAALFTLAQLLLLDSERFFSWDEAVYTSQVSPFANAVSMGAHRARGVTLIVAPVAALTDSMLPLRFYLAVVSGAALLGAFLVWCRSVRWAAPIAAALFATSWVTIYYGSAVYPNLYSALIAVAAIGLALQAANAENRPTLYLLAGLVAAGALLRPPEAVIVSVCVVLVGFVERRDRLPELSIAAIGGLALGSVPWLIEAWVRFDGPLQRLEAAGSVVGGGFHNNLTDYLRSLDGSSGPINRWALIWLGILLVLGLAGLFQTERKLQRISGTTMVAAFLLVAPYLFATEPIAQRFMLPGYALLCVGSALGIKTIVDRSIRPVPAAIVLTVVILLATAWNFQALQTWDDRQVGNAETALTLGQAIRDRVESNDCFVLSPFNYPAISFASGCPGGLLRETILDNQRLLSGRVDTTVYAVTPDANPAALLGGDWRCEPVADLADRGWRICSLIG